MAVVMAGEMAVAMAGEMAMENGKWKIANGSGNDNGSGNGDNN